MQRKKFVKLEETYSGEVFYRRKNITAQAKRLCTDTRIELDKDLDSELERVAMEARVYKQANAYSEPPQPLELAAVYSQYGVRRVYFYRINPVIITQSKRTR